MDKSYEYLKNKLNINDSVVIALSGGPDSMVLLDLLLKLRKNKNISIVCAHINHNIRIESADEEKFVQKYCDDNSVIFEYMKIEDYNGEFSEEKARNIRYEFFKSIANKYNAKYILTAHHGDDLIETILMRMVRGSNLKGYAGFNIETNIDKYTFLKPLIYYTKDNILKYAKENNIPYVIDKTNNNDDYTRNRYRHNILPFLKNEDNNVNIKFLKFSETLYEYENYINKLVIEKMNIVYNNKCVNINEYKLLDNLIQKKLLEEILKSIYIENNINLINDKHILEIDNLIKGTKPNGIINLPNNIIAKRNYDTLSFELLNNIETYNIELNKDLILSNGKEFKFIENEDTDSNYVCRLNSKEIKMPLYIRTRIDGDKIEVKNLGTKKVKNIFIDSKISLDDRNTYPLLVDSNNTVLWIPGVKKSKYNKEKTDLCDIIIKYN